MSDYTMLSRVDALDGDVPMQRYSPEQSVSKRGSQSSFQRKPLPLRERYESNVSDENQPFTESPLPFASPPIRGNDYGDISFASPSEQDEDAAQMSGRFSPFQKYTPRFSRPGYEANRRQSSRSLLQHPPTAVADDLDRNFDSDHQLRDLLLAGFLKWLVTVILLVILGLTIDYFKSKDILTEDQKRWFNAWNAGISIALGLNIASALKQMSLDLRWRILSQHVRSLREVDLILQCDSMTTLLKLCWQTRRIKVIIVCLGVLCFNLFAQIGIAAVSLTYSTDPTSAIAILIPNSEIWITDLSSFATPMDTSPSQGVQRSTANALGYSSTAYSAYNASDPNFGFPKANTTWASNTADYWLEDDGKTWRYVLIDTPPVAGQPDLSPGGPTDISIYSDRTISSNGSCTAYAMDVNSTSGNWYYQGTTEALDNYPPTLSLSSSFKVNSSTETCNNDDRSAYVEVFETGNNDLDEGPTEAYWYYSCCISVSDIGNATDNKPQILPNMSYTAAAAIGLQGYVDYDYDSEYKIYQKETYWGTPMRGDQDGMALLISKFAIGVFVTAGYQNPMNKTIGLQPQQGTTLSISHFVLMIVAMSLIGGLHFLSFIICAFLANRVVIPDEGPLSMARSLGPIVAGLGGRGGLLTSKEIAKVLDRKLLYGLVEAKDEGLRICFENVPPVRAFPDGKYV